MMELSSNSTKRNKRTNRKTASEMHGHECLVFAGGLIVLVGAPQQLKIGHRFQLKEDDKLSAWGCGTI